MSGNNINLTICKKQKTYIISPSNIQCSFHRSWILSRTNKNNRLDGIEFTNICRFSYGWGFTNHSTFTFLPTKFYSIILSITPLTLTFVKDCGIYEFEGKEKQKKIYPYSTLNLDFDIYTHTQCYFVTVQFLLLNSSIIYMWKTIQARQSITIGLVFSINLSMRLAGEPTLLTRCEVPYSCNTLYTLKHP